MIVKRGNVLSINDYVVNDWISSSETVVLIDDVKVR